MHKLVLLVAGMAASLVAAGAAMAVTPDQLNKAGWTCFRDPGAPRTVCFDPGHGRPALPADPNGPASYNVKYFVLDGTFIGTAHLIRADLYQGQPCAQSGAAYLFIAPIGYYRCEHF
ncbi:MAG: hypothetical protein ACJ74N_02255 [Gaiellaceae bacterium]|jgi:hypothetical protein